MTVTKVLDIAYVRIGSEDLDAAQAFNECFGLLVHRGIDRQGKNVLYSSSMDGLPYHHVTEEGERGFLGVGFEAASRSDLELLAQQPGASEIEPIQAPGGGEKVSFTDLNGFEVDVIFGWKRGVEITPADRPPLNIGGRTERLQQHVRLSQKRSQVKRLGHCVLMVKDFRESEAWYKNLFGFLTSDEIYAGSEDNVIGAFLRCDRGSTPVDHHAIALIQPSDPSKMGMQHAAFEVHDWDDLMIGHYALANGGYKSQWGVGKHFLGSQIFDYWFDPNGQIMEHFTDGDLFDASQPPKLESIEMLLGSQWGPEQTLLDPE